VLLAADHRVQAPHAVQSRAVHGHFSLVENADGYDVVCNVGERRHLVIRYYEHSEEAQSQRTHERIDVPRCPDVEL
jgi:hypothetical protein